MAMVNGPKGGQWRGVLGAILEPVMFWRTHRRGKLGQAIVETALLFLILCLMVMGSTDLGRVFYSSIAVTNAAREGARQGSSYDPVNGNASATHAAVIAAVQSEAADLNLVEPNPPFSPANCISGPPYADAYYPSTPNTGYVLACFNENPSSNAGTPGQTVRVTILYNFSPVTPLIENVAGNIHVQATTTMVIQGQP